MSNGNILDEKNVAIAVMGPTGSGKTSFINLVSGSDLQIGMELQSCTSEVQMSNTFELDGRLVTLFDTPGFDDSTKSDTEVLKMIAAFLATAYQHGGKLAGVIYFHRISDFRMGGISRRNFKMFKKFCGDDTLKNVVILTNMWGEVSREVGEAREAQLASQDMFFKPALDNGAQLLRHENTLESGQKILRTIFRNHPLALHIQRELVDEGKDIMKTAAAEELNRELMEQVEKYRIEISNLREEMKEAIADKDREMQAMLDTERKKLELQMTKIQTDSANLKSNYDQERARLERLVQSVNDSAKEQAALAREERQELVKALERSRRSSGCCIQ